MNPSRLTRRLVAGAAGLALGVAGTLALASPASAHHPTVDGNAVCDEATGEWVITWTVANSEHDLTGTLSAVTVTPEATLTTIVVGATLPVSGDGPLQEEQRVPGDTTAASLTVEGTWIRDGNKIVKSADKSLELGGECAPGEEPPEDEELGEFSFDCETLKITFTNPTEEELTVAFVPSTGDAVELAVAPGETGEAEFTASEGLSVAVQINGEDVELEEPIEITSEEWAELNCDEDDGGAGGGDDDEPALPLTGSSTTLIAGGALALLALGGGMYLVARRRRVTFTA